MSDLPEDIIPIRTVRILRNKRKYCECYEWHTIPKKAPRFELDSQNREVICKHCGNIVDAFDAIAIISNRWEDVSAETNRLLDQAKELRDYKPWLRATKSFERSIDRGKMIPICPHCSKGILLEEMTNFRSKEYELQRRKFETENDG